MDINITDPGNNLPDSIYKILPSNRKGILMVPDHGVSIHPDSVKRLLYNGSDIPLAYIPEIPVASTLGLPRFQPLLYWVPDVKHENKSRVSQLLNRIRKPKIQFTKDFNPPVETVIINETNKVEQIHYFVDNFGRQCPVPIQVSVVVSNVCNLKCIMCPYHSPYIKTSHQTGFFNNKMWMKWEMMEKIASECGHIHVPVKMGNIEEPLLHPRIIDFVKLCRDQGVPTVHITTNGQPLTPEISQQLLEAGLTSMYISIDAANPDTYRRIRGASLEKVEHNVQTFLDIRKALGSSCLLMMSFVRNNMVSEAEVNQFCQKWVEKSDGVIVYNLAEYEQGNARFIKINSVAQNRIQEAGGRWPCLNPFQEIYILPNGQTYYCCETISKLAFESLMDMGEFPEKTIRQLWLDKPFQSLRRDLIINQLDDWPACKNCGIWMAHVTETVVENGLRITRNMITEILQKC